MPINFRITKVAQAFLQVRLVMVTKCLHRWVMGESQSNRRPVGGGHQGDALVPHAAKKAIQDGSIRHVRHKKLVQAEDPHLGCRGLSDPGQRVLLIGMLPQHSVDLQHEVVEMQPAQLQTLQTISNQS